MKRKLTFLFFIFVISLFGIYNLALAQSPNPPTSLPETPIHDATDVFSIYSDAYTSAPGSAFTFAASEQDEVTVLGDKMLYCKIGTGGTPSVNHGAPLFTFTTPINIEEYNTFFVDIYAVEANAFDLRINFNDAQLTRQVKTGWNRLELDLNDFRILGADFTQIATFRFTGTNLRNIYIDNIYACKAIHTDMLSAPSTPAPTPTDNSSDVLPIFTDAYSGAIGVTFNSLTVGDVKAIKVLRFSGDFDKMVYVKNSNGGNGGLNFASAVDISKYDFIHFDVYPVGSTIAMRILLNAVSSTNQSPYITTASNSNQWNSIDIPLNHPHLAAAMASDLTNVKDRGFWLFAGNGGYRTFFLDNVYFYNAKTTWTGNTSSSWTVASNWNNGVPTALHDVTIPGNCANYPVLTAADAAVCDSIYFETGGEIGQIQHLTYNAASVELNLGYYDEDGTFANAKPTSKYLQRDRFYTITAPLKEMVSGDFAFGGKPTAYAQYADPINGEMVDPVQGFTNTLPYYNIALTKGFGFAYLVNPADEEGNTLAFEQTNLNKADGIVVFPHFANDDLRGKLNPLHDFSGTTSTFSYYKSDGSGVSDRDPDVVERNLSLANRFIAEDDETGAIPASFTLPLNAAEGETLVGNPFLSHLDFGELYKDNDGGIDSYYRIWSDKSLYVVHVDENGDVASSNPNGEGSTLIAPLQSFFVKTRSDADLTINVENVSVTKANGASEPALRQAGNNTESLKIIARNQDYASAVVLLRKTVQAGNSVRKVFTSYEEVPELYIGVQAMEILNIDKTTLSVPLGIRALDGESITLTFAGINNISDRISLYDALENRTVTLDENTSYSFTNDATLSDRFFVLFGENGQTGIRLSGNVFNSNISYKDNQIKVTSSPLNLIRLVKIYTAQGQLIANDDHLSTTVFSTNIASKGVYIVEILTENAHEIKKIVNY
jgi:hypothetical protein